MKPLITDPFDWFAELDRSRQGFFLENAKDRNQPTTPCRDIFDNHLPERAGTIN